MLDLIRVSRGLSGLGDRRVTRFPALTVLTLRLRIDRGTEILNRSKETLLARVFILRLGRAAAGAGCDTSKSIPPAERSAYNLRADRNPRGTRWRTRIPHDRLALPLPGFWRSRSLARAGRCARLPGRDVRHGGDGVHASGRVPSAESPSAVVEPSVSSSAVCSSASSEIFFESFELFRGLGFSN